MGSLFRKKRFVAILLFTLAVSLGSMGVKLPSFNGISLPKPKPRPRAVITNQIKTCNQVLKKQLETADFVAVVTLSSVFVTETTSPILSSSMQFPRHAGLLSRAPPIAIHSIS